MVQKKSNVLDKPVAHKTSTAAAPAGSGAPVAADIDVKKLTVIFAFWKITSLLSIFMSLNYRQ